MKFQSEKIKVIKNKKGNIFKLLSKKSNLFEKFGEVYMSEVKPNKFKGWKLTNRYTQLLTVIKGTVEFRLKKNSKIKTKTISFPGNLSILKVPPNTYYCFKCKNKTTSIVLNITDRVF